jgi:triosephosphate isomerase
MKIIGLNWKLNPQDKSEALKLVKVSDKKNVIIFPPFVFLDLVRSKLKKAFLGAQDVFWEKSGAFTGEISPQMLKSVGVEYVLVGHSERRKYFNEDWKIINKKTNSAALSGLKTVLCVGEGENMKNSNIESVKKYLKFELERDLKGIDGRSMSDFIIAYEPAWAIGTGIFDDPVKTAIKINFIKKVLKSKKFSNYSVIYGGSVNLKNIKDFYSEKEIDGLLLGGMSLKANDLRIIFKQFV